MKYFITALLLILFIIPATGVYAITPTATPAPTISKQEKLLDEINNLREKVASKVAELNLVEKRGIFIVAEDVSGNKITGNDLQDNTRIVDVDELTKFSSTSQKASFGISDITKGTWLSVLGLYNKQSKRILARFVDTVTLPLFISGEITDIDKVNYTITVFSENKISTLIDIENITKTSSYTKDNGLIRLGFSKLNVGDRAYVVGYADAKEKNRMSASRIFVFPELVKNPKITIPGKASSDFVEKPTATPSAKVKPTQ
jgi:hypothetical protein